jgi:hypothetical protein
MSSSAAGAQREKHCQHPELTSATAPKLPCWPSSRPHGGGRRWLNSRVAIATAVVAIALGAAGFGIGR